MKRQWIAMRLLTDSERSEAEMLLDRLVTRVAGFKDGSAYERYFSNMCSERNLDLLRCMDRMFTRDDRELFFSIERSQEIAYHLLEQEGSAFLTPEMVEMESRIGDHAMLSRHTNLTVFVFENMDRAEEILHLIEHRDITDIDTIKSMLKDIDITAHPEPLRGGII